MMRSFILVFFSLVAMVYVGVNIMNYLGQLNRLLRKTVSGGKVLNQQRIRRRLLHFLREHTVLMRDIISINRRFVSPFLVHAMASNFIWNVYLISVFTYSNLSVMVKLQALGWFTGQFIAFIIGMQPLIYLVLRFHSADQILYMLQPRFNRESVRLKIKLLAYYETIHTKTKFYFTLGELGSVSKRAMTEVSDRIRDSYS